MLLVFIPFCEQVQTSSIQKKKIKQLLPFFLPFLFVITRSKAFPAMFFLAVPAVVERDNNKQNRDCDKHKDELGFFWK